MTRKQTHNLLFHALRLRQQGLTLEKIGRELNISIQLAGQWVKKATAMEKAMREEVPHLFKTRSR